MFRLIQVEDVLRVRPENFGLDRFERLEREANAKYSNRVLPGYGLAVALYDWVSVGDDRLLHGDGGAFTRVVFRLVVFCPDVGEVLLARVRGCDAVGGVALSLNFFDDLRVPPEALQQPSEYDAAERAWKWRYEDSELYIYRNDYVWVRITEVTFNGGTRSDMGSEGGLSLTSMSIRGSMSGDGLGVISWWT